MLTHALSARPLTFISNYHRFSLENLIRILIKARARRTSKKRSSALIQFHNVRSVLDCRCFVLLGKCCIFQIMCCLCLFVISKWIRRLTFF